MTLATPAITCLSIFTLCYSALCAASPFGNCRKCKGFGYKLTTDRRGRLKRGKHCRRCNGHGKRIRIGRHLWNLARRAHREGTR